MALLQEWRDVAYSQEADKAQLQKFWTNYFLIEKGIYEKLLTNPDEVVRGTVKDLADKFEVDVMTMVGFLDGINDSLKVQNPIEEMDENTEVNPQLLGISGILLRILFLEPVYLTIMNFHLRPVIATDRNHQQKDRQQTQI